MTPRPKKAILCGGAILLVLAGLDLRFLINVLLCRTTQNFPISVLCFHASFTMVANGSSKENGLRKRKPESTPSTSVITAEAKKWTNVWINTKGTHTIFRGNLREIIDFGFQIRVWWPIRCHSYHDRLSYLDVLLLDLPVVLRRSINMARVNR